MSHSIASVILAGGESKRMGTPKALLGIGGSSFVRTIVNLYRRAAFTRIIVVAGAHAPEIEQELADCHVSVLRNEHYRLGQLSSIITALNALPPDGVDGICVHPVDHPRVAAATIAGLVQAFMERRGPVVLPRYGGKRGHPVIFAARLFDELRGTPPDVGARGVVWSHAAEVAELATEDEGVMLDIDTPEEYENLQRNL